MQNNVKNIQVKFVAIQKKYAVTDLPISVPLDLKRYGLSEIVNHLLELDPIVPFDILINKKFLRTTLEVAVQEQELSTETLLTLEFCEAFAAPQNKSVIKTDDWVSALKSINPKFHVAGLYDNTIQIMNMKSGECISKLAVHSGSVKSVAVIKKDENCPLVVSGSQDQTIAVTKYNIKTNTLEKSCTLKGHGASVETVAVNDLYTHIISGSWDADLRIWKTNPEDSEIEFTAKKAKGHSKIIPKMESLAVFQGHSGPVSSCSWKDNSTFISASWDHSIRTWDVESGVNTQTMAGPNSIHDISLSPSSSLIASANADSTVRVWDTRTKEGSMITLSLTGHSGMVSCVSWSSSNNQNHFATGSYDNTVKLWDLRSSVPIHTIKEHTDNVLCVDWNSADIIASGGADSTAVFSSSN